ncbi:MAG: 2TM domain-containing protein [Methanomassiliicoccales archaeon]
MVTEDELRRRAQKIAEEKAGLWVHLAAYVFVNSFMIVIWWWSGGGFPWFIFLMGGWGIGLVAHIASVYFGPQYVDKLAEKEYQKMKNKNN